MNNQYAHESKAESESIKTLIFLWHLKQKIHPLCEDDYGSGDGLVTSVISGAGSGDYGDYGATLSATEDAARPVKEADPMDGWFPGQEEARKNREEFDALGNIQSELSMRITHQKQAAGITSSTPGREGPGPCPRSASACSTPSPSSPSRAPGTGHATATTRGAHRRCVTSTTVTANQNPA